MADPQFHDHVFLIEVNKISPNPYQPRRDFNQEELQNLANSIREFGILQPLVVTKLEETTESGTNVSYQLIAGERRFRAAQLVGLERVPAVVKNVALDRERLELAIIENVQRANLNPIEAARAYNRLAEEFRLTQREIAQRMSKSREVVANAIRLLNLPAHMQQAVGDGRIGESQARMLLMIDDDPNAQQSLFDEVMSQNLSVREMKNKIDYLRAAKKQAEQAAAAPVAQADPEAVSIKQQLEEALGLQVQVTRENGVGKITIPFSSPEELYTLLQKMTTKKETQIPAVQSEPAPEVVPLSEQEFTV